jgi:hypothetical protein
MSAWQGAARALAVAGAAMILISGTVSYLGRI